MRQPAVDGADPDEGDVRARRTDRDRGARRYGDAVALAARAMRRRSRVEPGETVARFRPQPEGGYGVEAEGARTALDVLADPFARARYGFVSNYGAGRDVDRVADNARRLHLNCVQFYDWMFRHAEL